MAKPSLNLFLIKISSLRPEAYKIRCFLKLTIWAYCYSTISCWFISGLSRFASNFLISILLLTSRFVLTWLGSSMFIMPFYIDRNFSGFSWRKLAQNSWSSLYSLVDFIKAKITWPWSSLRSLSLKSSVSIQAFFVISFKSKCRFLPSYKLHA